MATNIGFIGLGIMGKPMALNLIRAGYHLVVHSRSRGPVDEMVAAGATAASTPADVARQTDCVITMLPDTADVELVVSGAHGIVVGLKAGAIVIDMSTISPIATERLAKAVASAGGHMLDAPVSGGEVGAKAATLTIVVGGNHAAFERARPILACMGNPDRVMHIGPSGAGQTCKLCGQIAVSGALAGVSEAFALAEKSGIDKARVREALLGGFSASKVLEVHGERVLAGNYRPGFSARLFQKDLRLVHETATANAVATPATSVVSHLVDALVAAGGGHLDYAAVATMWLEKADGVFETELR